MRWKELSEGKTSDQLMSVLLEEIQGDQGEGGSTAEFFEGQVSGRRRHKPHVACHLRIVHVATCSESQMTRHVYIVLDSTGFAF